MCDWGTDAEVEVTVPAHLSHTGRAHKAVKKIDACIAPIVRALNEGGIETWGSCCGHGRGEGSITLADGRTLIVLSISREPARGSQK